MIKLKGLVMKKVFVVSNTHLDLGFTDYAENIREKYISNFIPGAFDLAHKLTPLIKNHLSGLRAHGF